MVSPLFVSGLFLFVFVLFPCPVKSVFDRYPMTRSMAECSITCAAMPECYSFYYDVGDGSCYIVDGYVHQGGPFTEAKYGVVYYSKPSPQMLCKFLLNYSLDPQVRLCYKIHYQQLEFQPAREACQVEGADLASAKTLDIRHFYINLLHSDPFDVFFGATDAVTTGVWRWMDGSLWSDFTTSSNKHCLEYYHGGMFAPEHCHGVAHRFACEIALPKIYH